jgi:hypothetical protein
MADGLCGPPGTGILVATVVGSGIMAETLTKDVALALLCNTLPTGAILLIVLITVPLADLRRSLQSGRHAGLHRQAHQFTGLMRPISL